MKGSFNVALLVILSILFWTWVVFVVIRERSEWHGETKRGPITGAQFSGRRALFERETDDGHIVDFLISETVSHNPRVKVFHDFLTAEECDALLDEGLGFVAPSHVVSKTGGNVKSSSRSSSGTFLIKRTPLIRKLESRIARATMLPQENQEAFYLLRYNVGEEYKTHPDYFAKETPEAEQVVENGGGQRVATVLLYLNDVPGGGSTRFVKGGIEVKAKRGQALFWWDTHANGTVDANSWHSGLPVTKGVKYAATKWIRERAFGTRKKH